MSRDRIWNTVERACFDLVPDPIWDIDPATLTFLDVNAAAERQLGYSAAEISPKTIAEVMVEDDRPAFEAATTEIGYGDRDDRVWRLRPRSGAAIAVRFEWRRTEIGNRPAFLAFPRHIGPEASDWLAQTATLLRIAGRTAKLGGWRVELTSTKIIWSPETAAIHDEPDGTSPAIDEAFDYYAPEYRQQIRTAFQACATEGKPFDETLQIITAKGRRRWVRAIGEAMRSQTGAILAVQGAFQDIDAQIKAQEEKTHIARRLTETMESMGDAFYLLDDKFYFTYLNPQAEKLLKRRASDLVGRNVWDEFPEARETILWDVYHRSFETGRHERFQFHYPALDRWFEVDAHPATDGLAVYFRDVSENRELEARLRQSQKMEAIGQLTGGVAHDFNNILTVILGNAEMLSEKLTEHQQLRFLAEMTATAAERGAELTNRLLAFSRRQALVPKLVDLNRVVAGVESLCRRTVSENIEVELVRAGGLWGAEIDPGQLETAMLNLIINARDAMIDGGKLTIETGNTVLDDTYAEQHDEVTPGQYVMVSVSDTGKGMPKAVAERAFEPFFTTKEVGKGSGLGLSMVYGFVKQSRGHIKVYSEVGEGTTVKLYFPRASDRGVDPGDRAGDQPWIGGDEHILVVEDNDLVRDHLAGQLKEMGYQVSTAASGPEALSAIHKSPDIDLLLTDVVMPGGMNGRQLADAAAKVRSDLRVLFTSGYTENAIVHHGRLDRGVQLLSKPYRRQELAAKVRKVLDE